MVIIIIDEMFMVVMLLFMDIETMLMLLRMLKSQKGKIVFLLVEKRMILMKDSMLSECVMIKRLKVRMDLNAVLQEYPLMLVDEFLMNKFRFLH
jgi:hypothetical protein